MSDILLTEERLKKLVGQTISEVAVDSLHSRVVLLFEEGSFLELQANAVMGSKLEYKLKVVEEKLFTGEVQ